MLYEYGLNLKSLMKNEHAMNAYINSLPEQDVAFRAQRRGISVRQYAYWLCSTVLRGLDACLGELVHCHFDMDMFMQGVLHTGNCAHEAIRTIDKLIIVITKTQHNEYYVTK